MRWTGLLVGTLLVGCGAQSAGQQSMGTPTNAALLPARTEDATVAIISTDSPVSLPTLVAPSPTLEAVEVPILPPTQTLAPSPTLEAVGVPILPPTQTLAPSPTLTPFEVSVFPSDPIYTDSIGFQVFLTGDVAEEQVSSATITYRRAGIIVYQRTDTVAPFCSFGEGECEQWDFAATGATWPDGTPAEAGDYVAVAEVTSVDGRTGTGKRPFTLVLGAVSAEPRITILPDSGTVGDELAFEAVIDDPSLVQQVDFSIAAPDGSTLHTRTERNVRYCAFGGGDNGSACGVWRFSEQGNLWPNGAQVEANAAYTIVATALLADGRTISASTVFSVALP